MCFLLERLSLLCVSVATEVLVCSFRSLAVIPVDKYSILRKQILQLAMVSRKLQVQNFCAF